MEYQTATAKKEFDAWSRSYDRSLLQSMLFGPAHQLLMQALGPVHQRILDIGCGTGRFAARVLEHFPQAQVWGLDLSPGMLNQCQGRCQNARGRLHLVQGDSEHLPFASDSFDVVTSSHSFHHYPHQERAVNEMHRVLRPGGRLLILDGDPTRLWGKILYDLLVVMVEGPVRHLTRQGFRNLFTAVGFSNITQVRKGRFIPFCLTTGQAEKPGQMLREEAAFFTNKAA